MSAAVWHRSDGSSSPGRPASERRQHLLEVLLASGGPVTGTELADRLGVSRQIIVQDCALLRASGEDIIATPQGYVLPTAGPAHRAVLACRHDRQRTVEELNIMVDHGLKVIDVVVEHALYGELRGMLMLASREDVAEFADRVEREQVTLLSELTGGVHLHTVEAPSEERLDKAREALRQGCFLVD